jgi:hypothetical protein
MGLRGDNKIFQYGPSRSYFLKKSWGIFFSENGPEARREGVERRGQLLGAKGCSAEQLKGARRP